MLVALAALVMGERTMADLGRNREATTGRAWMRSEASRERASSVRAKPASEIKPVAQMPFVGAYVLTIDPAKSTEMQKRLADEGVHPEMHMGFDGRTERGKASAMSFLTKYGYTKRLHPSFSIPFACMHTSPNHAPKFGQALAEVWSGLWRGSSTLSEMLKNDQHNCVAKVVSIAAGHASVWKSIAEREENADAAKGWYLIAEDDVSFCPGWLQRLSKELPMAPADADAVKLSFFGHWREEDAVGYNISRGQDWGMSSFFQTRRAMDSKDVVGACVTELLSGNGWSNVPCAGFYAGNQAYMITKQSAKKLLSLLEMQPFQDIDMMMMEATKTYAFRHVLAGEAMAPLSSNSSFIEVGAGAEARSRSRVMGVPQCNAEPPGR